VSDFKRGLSARFLHDDRENMPPKTLDALIFICDFLLRTAFFMWCLLMCKPSVVDGVGRSVAGSKGGGGSVCGDGGGCVAEAS
jgi:hypothetical protein